MLHNYFGLEKNKSPPPPTRKGLICSKIYCVCLGARGWEQGRWPRPTRRQASRWPTWRGSRRQRRRGLVSAGLSFLLHFWAPHSSSADPSSSSHTSPQGPPSPTPMSIYLLTKNYSIVTHHFIWGYSNDLSISLGQYDYLKGEWNLPREALWQQ